MSEEIGGAKRISPGEIMAAAVAALLPPVIAVFLIVKLVLSIQASHIDMDNPANQEKAVLSRISPVGEVAVLDTGRPQAERSGEEVYNAACGACHGSGTLGAPKKGDKAAWASRIGKGLDGLVKSAIAGKGAMPARGGNPDIADGELARAIVYMTGGTGASFKVPATAPAAAKVDGKAVYDSTCGACHGTGVAGAPKFGDNAAWASRLKGGVSQLVASAAKGKGAMPAKGGNAALSDAELKAAVEYLVSASK